MQSEREREVVVGGIQIQTMVSVLVTVSVIAYLRQ